MNMLKTEKDIFLDGKRFIYIKDRLAGGSVFVSQDRSEYLRTSTKEEIEGEVNLTKDLYNRKFPVPLILKTGILENGINYYIEKSIGDRVFGDIFKEETRSFNYVNDESFNMFIEIIKKYCEVQFNKKNFVPHNINSLDEVISISNVMKNNEPSYKIKESFIRAYEKAKQRVMSLPWGYIQPDLNAFNILPNGIIDFELSGFGPVGYDVLTNIYFNRMWPSEKIAYIFTDNQIIKYIKEVDKIAIKKGLPLISQYIDDFLVLKTIWGTAKDKESENNPQSNLDFWNWRVKIRDWSIHQYLNGKNIDTSQFEKIGTSI